MNMIESAYGSYHSFMNGNLTSETLITTLPKEMDSTDFAVFLAVFEKETYIKKMLHLEENRRMAAMYSKICKDEPHPAMLKQCGILFFTMFEKTDGIFLDLREEVVKIWLNHFDPVQIVAMKSGIDKMIEIHNEFFPEDTDSLKGTLDKYFGERARKYVESSETA